jgi:hypothetical protein
MKDMAFNAFNTLAPDQRARVLQAREETARFLRKEAGYSEDLRNVELVEIYKKHLARLDDLILGP